MYTNGWRALDQLGVGTKLRSKAIPLQMYPLSLSLSLNFFLFIINFLIYIENHVAHVIITPIDLFYHYSGGVSPGWTKGPHKTF